MSSSASTERPGDRISPASLRGAGLTDAQAGAITDLTQAIVSDAADRLRDEIACWHAYLALYVVSQIGIAILAILLTQGL